MSGTGEDPLPGFPAIGQYELVPEPGEPDYVEPEAVEAAGDDAGEPELDGDPDDLLDPDDDDPFADDEE
jgi:hypothetical protein